MSFLETLPSELQSKIIAVIKKNPESVDAFNSLYFHLYQTLQPQPDQNKKRKLSPDTQDTHDVSIEKDSIILKLPKISIQSPVRKKLDLIFVLDKASGKPALCLVNDNLEPELVISDLSNRNISYAAFLPVPEKPKLVQLAIFYKNNFGSKFNNDPIVASINQDVLTKDLKSEGFLKSENSDFKQLIITQANICGFAIEDPFGPGNSKSFFVEAHKGTKEGLLFFLPNNIIFGFKKPILFFEAKDVTSISYTSITRVTFNVTMIISGHDENGETEEKIEFSMIDQSEFASIDAYVKAKEVKDNSMAEELKAKPVKGKAAENGGELDQALQESVVPENDEDSEEEDETYQIGEEVDDTSDVSSGDENVSDGDEDGDESDMSGGSDDDDDGDDDEGSE